jgi:hypothetical protein
VQVLIVGSAGGSCWVLYDRPTNTVTMVDDGGLGGTTAPGLFTFVAGQQCWLEGGKSWVVTDSTFLVVNFRVGFKSGFSGIKTVYAMVTDNMGWSTPWLPTGTWNAVPSALQPPTADSVTPSSGSGSAQLFTAAFSDPNGHTDLAWVRLLITTGGEPNACYVLYDRQRNLLFLADESATTLYGALTPGVAGTLQNQQCLLYGAASAVSGQGSTLNLSLSIAFKSSFAGLHYIFGVAEDTTGWSTGFRYKGSWTAAAVANQQPAAIAVTPASGAGTAAKFTFSFSDPNGYQDIAWTQVLISSATGGAACFLFYDRTANSLTLLGDATSAGGAGTPGKAAKIETGQCAVDLGASSVLSSGPNLTMALALSFKPAFAGQKLIRLAVQDMAGWNTGWQSRGSWTAP